MNQSTPQLEIIRNDTVSINNLVDLQAAGYSVLRSAHVGNLSPYNMVLANAGIPLLSVDHTITGVDTNYFPESINTQNQNQVIAPLGRLACRTTVGNGYYLDEVHIAGALEALPGATIYTNTEYLRANESIAGEVVDLAVKEFPELFTRIAQPDGTTREDKFAANHVKKLGIMQLIDEPRGENEAVLMPNLVDIVTNFTIEALNSERDTQYHLSGPAMANYTKDAEKAAQLSTLYARLCETASFKALLPKHLQVQLVLATAAKYATTNLRAPHLTSLLDTFAKLKAISDRKAAQFACARNELSFDRASVIAKAKTEQAAVEQAIAEHTTIMPELFIEPGNKESGFITQYDVLQESGLFVAPMNLETSMADLKVFSKALGKYINRSPV